jgi:CRP/FNR family cyclic AMP-dependent transcriptional regulator
VADPKIEHLRKVPLFTGLGDAELARIGQLGDEVAVPGGTALTREGGFAHEFFVILEGRARVERDGGQIASLGPGDFLGEIALLDGKPRSADVTTEESSHLFVLGHREFHSLLESYPAIQLHVLKAMAERVRRSEPEAD